MRVKGKEKAVAIYEPIGLCGEVSADIMGRLEVFKQALAMYRNQSWSKAKVLFKNIEESSLHVVLCQLYLLRIKEMRIKELGADWDGAFTLETK